MLNCDKGRNAEDTYPEREIDARLSIADGHVNGRIVDVYVCWEQALERPEAVMKEPFFRLWMPRRLVDPCFSPTSPG